MAMSRCLNVFSPTGADLGKEICQRFEEDVTLPRAPTEKQNGFKEQDDADVLKFNWRDLSLESSMSFSSSLSTKAKEKCTGWLEWRKKEEG